MRLATVRNTSLAALGIRSGALSQQHRRGSTTTACRVEGDHAVVLDGPDVGALLAHPDWRERAASAEGPSVPVDELDLAPLVPHPEKILCIGVNYQSHLDEVGLDRPDFPTVFAKYDRALIGANDGIELSSLSQCTDWEVELAVIVGSPMRHVREEDALSGVAGYTILNDVTMRDWQFRTTQFLQGKTFEATTPLGPVLVTPDEVGHGDNLRMTCTVDDVVMQSASTSELLFPVSSLLSYLSSFITLMPGDIVATGTPAGVGAAMNPPVYLQPGQVLRSAIEGLGEQRNACLLALNDDMTTGADSAADVFRG